MENRTETRELISALADGQLQGEAFARAVEAATADPAAREAWQSYHLIGDVLRSGDLVPVQPPELFLQRLQQRLHAEPAPLSYMRQAAALAETGGTRRQPVITTREAANDSSLRWKLTAGFASVAAAAAVGWNVAGTAPQQPQLVAAQPPAAVATATERGTMLRNPHLDRLLAAHRQLGGATALQNAGFLRNATYEGPGR